MWLIGASLVFYTWWNIHNLQVLLFSILANWGFASTMLAARRQNWADRQRGILLLAGIGLNLSLLGFFKYTNFMVNEINAAFGADFIIANIVLPLGISFFTFQKIALLVDIHGGQVSRLSFIDYCLFVTFFPQLIAGPIVHHSEVMPQFSRPETFRFRPDDFAQGATLFLAGLFKKVVVADGLLLPWVTTFLGHSQWGQPLAFADAWGGGVLLSLHLYFDFSAYSDMAAGLGLLFGVRLPFNFASPFKASNTIEFWQRWHISLTNFLTAYIFNPIVVRIGRQRIAKGKPLMRKGGGTVGAFTWLMVVPILVTMTLAGVWHGAGWQFVAYGVLLGILLVINHSFRFIRTRLGYKTMPGWTLAPSVLLTFLSVVVALSVIRAPDMATAWTVFKGQCGLGGFAAPTLMVEPAKLAIIAALLVWCWWAPNSQEWLGLSNGAISRSLPWRWLTWKPTAAWAVTCGVAALYALSRLSDPSAFLYFNF